MLFVTKQMTPGVQQSSNGWEGTSGEDISVSVKGLRGES